MNKFPSDEADDFASLRREVEELKALIRGGGSFTTASAGWLLPNMPLPANPASGVHIFGNGNDFAVLTAGGVVKRIPAVGVAVTTPASPLTNATATYNQSQIQTIVTTVDNHHTALLALLASLRNAGHINT